MPIGIIESLDHEARGITRQEGKAIFVDGALPGETVEYASFRRKPNYELAHLVSVLKPSSARVTPRCPHFAICGGCAMQHMDPSAQLAAKQRVLEDGLWHIGRVRPESILPPIQGEAWGYRHRARLAVRKVERKGGVLIGFHEKRSSYMAGRLEQLMAVREERPYWQYLHSDAVEHPREDHEAWNGMVLRWDDPWWQYHFPINAWGCQCGVRALSEDDLRRMGKTGPDQAPPIVWVSRTIGQNSPDGPRVVEVPQGIDPGFVRDDAQLDLGGGVVEIEGDEPLACAGFQAFEHVLVARVEADHQHEARGRTNLFTGALNGQHAAVVGQRVQHDGGVFARFDHLVQVADGALAHGAG